MKCKYCDRETDAEYCDDKCKMGEEYYSEIDWVELGFDSCDLACQKGLPMTDVFCPSCVTNPIFNLPIPYSFDGYAYAFEQILTKEEMATRQLADQKGG